jgi:phosphoglycerate dehydrogenase-like enzyme
MGAGVDELIDRALPECAIATAKGLFATEVAEYIVGAVLFHLRGFGQYSALQAEHVWRPSAARRLQGQRGCLLGVGAVGSEVASRLRAFNVQLDAVVLHARPLANIQTVVAPEQRLSVLSGADFLVIAAPLTKATRGLVGARELSALARRAIVVNVGRGPIIDERALADALRSGVIGGAVLDVFAEEPLPPGNELWNAPNTLVTPHVAGLGLRYGDRCVERLVENVARLKSGLPLLGPFMPEEGY